MVIERSISARASRNSRGKESRLRVKRRADQLGKVGPSDAGIERPGKEMGQPEPGGNSFLLVAEACQIGKVPENYEVVFPERPGGASFSSSRETDQPEAGGGTRRTEFTRRIRLLWNTPQG